MAGNAGHKFVLRFVFHNRLTDHFIQRGGSGVQRPQTRVAEAHHPQLTGILANRIGAGPATDHVAEIVVHDHEFKQPGTAFEAQVVALIAAFAVVELPTLQLIGRDVQLHQLLTGRFVLRLAIRADAANQPLRLNRFHRGGNEIRLHAHIAKASDRGRGVVGVERTEHKVTRQRRLNPDLCGFQVANLTDEDDVRVLPENGPQRAGEGHVDLVIDRALHDAVNFVLDRVFGRDELGVDFVEFRQSGIESRGLAGTGWSGHQHDAIGLLDNGTEEREQVRRHANAIERQTDVGAVQNADNDAFAKEGGQDAHAHIDRVSANVQFDAAVLREPAFGDIEVRHNLDTAGDCGREVAWWRDHFVEHAIAPVTHLVFVFERFEVDVGSVVADRHQKNHVDELPHRRGVRHFHHVVEVDGVLAAHTRRTDVARLKLLDQRADRFYLLGGIGFGEKDFDLFGRGENRVDLLDPQEVP